MVKKRGKKLFLVEEDTAKGRKESDVLYLGIKAQVFGQCLQCDITYIREVNPHIIRHCIEEHLKYDEDKNPVLGSFKSIADLLSEVNSQYDRLPKKHTCRGG